MSFRRSTIFYHKRFITSSSLIPLSSLIQRLSTKKASTFMVFSSQFPFTFPFHDVVQQQRRRRQRRRRRWQQWRTPRIESIYRSSNIHNGLEQRVTSRLHEGMFFSSLHLFLFFPFLPFSLFPFFFFYIFFIFFSFFTLGFVRFPLSRVCRETVWKRSFQRGSTTTGFEQGGRREAVSLVARGKRAFIRKGTLSPLSDGRV